jgi:predicted ATP-dependent serine protease
MAVVKQILVGGLMAAALLGCGGSAGLGKSALKEAEAKAKADDPAASGVYPAESGAGKAAKK